MHSRRKFYAEQRKIELLEKCGYRCENPFCNNPASVLAHRISKSKSNFKSVEKLAERMFGFTGDVGDIIHHDFNFACVCSDPACNDSFNVGFNREKVKALVAKICTDLMKKEN